MTERPVEVWLFYPENTPSVVNQAKQIIRAECEKRQWAFQDRPTHLIKPDGRPIGQVKPQDATNLYQRIHRARVGVWQIEYANVPIRPKPKNTIADYITLSRFVLHKAYHKTLPAISLEDTWWPSLEEFLVWVEGTYCEGETDPRCLPFHVFETKLDLAVLESRDGRRGFARMHGAQSSRSDENGFKWTRGVLHGQGTLQVAGWELTTGFHWDVAGKAKQLVTTTSQVWQIKPNGYVNVSPDAHIRGNRKGAKQVYP